MEVTVPEFKITPKISLAPRKTALIIGDMLVDFVSPRGKLFVKDSRQTIRPIRGLLSQARKSGVMVVFIQDWHLPNDPEFSTWGAHAIQGSPGSQVIPELAPLPKENVVRKRTYDPFFGTDLDLLLRQKNIRTLVITGTVANICVLHAAASASLRGYEVIIPMDTLSALHPFDYQCAWRQISFVYQGKITQSSGIKFRK
jgi:nicotinamidase-related amidase